MNSFDEVHEAYKKLQYIFNELFDYELFINEDDLQYNDKESMENLLKLFTRTKHGINYIMIIIDDLQTIHINPELEMIQNMKYGDDEYLIIEELIISKKEEIKYPNGGSHYRYDIDTDMSLIKSAHYINDLYDKIMSGIQKEYLEKKLDHPKGIVQSKKVKI